MAKVSISIPDELLDQIEKSKGKHESFSSFCRTLFEKGLKLRELELEAANKILGANQ